ncbi:MAG: site-specific integrase [Deltaproteobacteria bacterium]|nr:site-specific integrase [Deltaproteobacteria bacterium]
MAYEHLSSIYPNSLSENRQKDGIVIVMPLYKDKKSPFWWMSYTLDGKRYRESTKTKNKRDAQLVLAKVLAERKPRAKGTVSILLDGLLKDYRINGKSLGWAQLVVETHLRPQFGSKKISAVTAEDLKDYIEFRLNAGVKNATINRELSLLRKSFNLADYSFPKIPKLAESLPRQGFLTDKEYENLCRNAPDHIVPIIIFAYSTGIRKGELLSLKWDQVDFEANVIRIDGRDTKNGESRTIPLSKQTAFMLRTMTVECDHVFTYRGKPIKNFDAAFKSAAKAAGLPNLLFHDLRRCFIRNMSRAGVPDSVAMKISGHKTRTVYDRYNIVSEADLHEAMRKREATLTGRETAVEGLLSGPLSQLFDD